MEGKLSPPKTKKKQKTKNKKKEDFFKGVHQLSNFLRLTYFLVSFIIPLLKFIHG
jgi:hypothetical protein